MARSLFDQATQVHSSETYVDSTAPTEAAFETNPTELQTDLNNIRSMLHELRDVRNSNWWSALTAPTTFTSDSGYGVRGIQDAAQDLWDTERKRILRRRQIVGASVGPIATNAQHVVLDAAGELPANTTIAVGAVTTLGTVAAYEASFDTATLTEVVGGDTLTPKNLAKIVDGASGDVIVDGTGREVHALLQSESNTDGHTATTTTPNRLQLSFVVHNATNDDLELAAAGVMDGKTIDYAPVERYAFVDIPEHSWLADLDFVDVGAGDATRQGVYNNQGTTPVDLTTNATLDLESAGIVWAIRDDLEANLWRIVEGSAGGTSEVEIGADVDLYDNNAADVDFDAGISANTGGTRPIDVGVTDGVVESTAGDLEIQATTELILSDGNESVGWSRNGILLSDTSTEWDNFETEFGEVSLLNAIVQAKQNAERASAWANVITADIAADTNVTGAGGSPNISAQMPSYNGLTFVDDVEVFVNGQKQRPGADAAANHDVYPGTSPSNGDLKFEYVLRYRGGVLPDNINVVVWGQPT